MVSEIIYPKIYTSHSCTLFYTTQKKTGVLACVWFWMRKSVYTFDVILLSVCYYFVYCSLFFLLLSPPPPIFCNIYHNAIVISRCIFIITFCMVGPVNLLIFQRLFPTRYLITIISLAASDLPLRGLMVKKKEWVCAWISLCVSYLKYRLGKRLFLSLSPARPPARSSVCLFVCLSVDCLSVLFVWEGMVSLLSWLIVCLSLSLWSACELDCLSVCMLLCGWMEA